MSHIPNSAMPHAIPSENEQTSSGTGEGKPKRGRTGKIADKARENPKTAIAAGAALAAGVIAAAAIPIVRSSRAKSEGKEKSGKKASSKKSS